MSTVFELTNKMPMEWLPWAGAADQDAYSLGVLPNCFLNSLLKYFRSL